MQIIYAVFDGSVIWEGSGKLAGSQRREGHVRFW